MTDIDEIENSSTAPRRLVRLRACGAVLADRTSRPLVLAWLMAVLVENVTWIGILVIAHGWGGAQEVGIVATAMLIPAMLVAPIASFAGDRFSRVRVLAVSQIAIGATSALVGVALIADLPRLTVYVLAALLTALVTFPGPTVAALTPNIVDSGQKLVALNVATGATRSVARALGPAAAGLLLALGTPTWLFVVAAVMSVVGAGCAGRLRPVATVVDDEVVSMGDIRSETLAGVRLLRREQAPRRVVTSLGLSSIAYGALDVGIVVVAVEHLERGQGITGVLGAAVGVGCIVGAAASVILVGRRRLAPALLLAGLAQALPLLGFSLPPSLAMAVVVFALCGAGVSLAEIAGQTLLQAITPDDLLARVFGVLEGVRMAGFALGSLAVSLSFAQFGVDNGSVVFALGVTALLVLFSRGVLAVDRTRPVVDPDLLELVRRVPMFAPLPAFSLEQLLQSFRRIELAEGDTLIAEGDVGDSMFLVAEGTLNVSKDGTYLRQRTVGEYVGEVALLFDVPRTATVTAAEPVVVLALDRDPFLEAITGHPRGLARATAQANDRIESLNDRP